MRKLIKIFLILIIITAITLTLVSCNMRFVGKYTFEHVYVETYKTEGHCYTVKKWTDSQSGIEVETKEAGTMFISEGNYILISDESKCPYCHNK